MMRIGFFAAFVFVAAAVPAFPQKSSTLSDAGLLLGVRSSGTHYHTLWIAFRNRTIHVEQVNGILVPRSDGFSWIGHYYTSTEFDHAPSDYGMKDASIEEHLLIRASEERSTISIKPPAKRILNPENYDNYCDQDSIVVDYAGPKYISMTEAGSDPCGQNPAVTVIYSHGSTDELTRDVPKPHGFTNTELLGDDSEIALEKDRDAGTIPECELIDARDKPMWTVTHRYGVWSMEGWQSVAMQCGGGRGYKIRMNPRPFVGRNEVFPPWKEIASKILGAVDAVSSPHRDYVVVMTSSDILIFRVDGKRWQPLGKFPLWVYTDDPSKTEHQIVMSEWALGRHVELWNEEVMRQKELRNSDQP